MPRFATIGAADHYGGAELVTVADGTALDRRRVELCDDDLPRHPHHHEGQGLPLADAVALVERVQACAERRAVQALDALVAAVPSKITGLSLRSHPPLPETIEARITDYRAQNFADSAMFRHALADAAAARGWSVAWYDRDRVIGQASALLADLDDRFEAARRSLGAPWRKEHRIAMAAAIVLGRAR